MSSSSYSDEEAVQVARAFIAADSIVQAQYLFAQLEDISRDPLSASRDDKIRQLICIVEMVRNPALRSVVLKTLDLLK